MIEMATKIPRAELISLLENIWAGVPDNQRESSQENDRRIVMIAALPMTIARLRDAINRVRKES